MLCSVSLLYISMRVELKYLSISRSGGAGSIQGLKSMYLMQCLLWTLLWALLREDKNPPRFLLNRVPEQITETNV